MLFQVSINTRLSLRHYGKRKIVAIATFVTGLQVIAADCYYRAIGQIGKGPGDTCGRGVADDGERGSYAESDTGFPSTAKVAPPAMVTPFAMTSSASELLPVALKV